MTPAKRALDIILALVLALLVAGPFLIILILLTLTEGRPLFYISERMQTPTRGFSLIKLRTMRPTAEDGGVTGGNKSALIPPVYRWLRRSRFDELPQLVNVLRGEMSFVGPRPPLRLYVEAFPALYAQVLQNRPGITGLASLRFHKHEEQLLAQAHDAQETDHIYRTRCVPRKARLDLIYQQHQSLCFDLALIWETAKRGVGR